MYSERYPTPSWHQKIFIDSLHAIRLRQQKIGKKSSYMCRLTISFRKVVLVFLWKHFGGINTVCFPKSPCFSSSECFSNNSYSCNFEANWCCCFFQCSFHSRLGVFDTFWKFIFSLNRAKKWFKSVLNTLDSFWHFGQFETLWTVLTLLDI